MVIGMAWRLTKILATTYDWCGQVPVAQTMKATALKCPWVISVRRQSFLIISHESARDLPFFILQTLQTEVLWKTIDNMGLSLWHLFKVGGSSLSSDISEWLSHWRLTRIVLVCFSTDRFAVGKFCHDSQSTKILGEIWIGWSEQYACSRGCESTQSTSGRPTTRCTIPQGTHLSEQFEMIWNKPIASHKYLYSRVVSN